MSDWPASAYIGIILACLFIGFGFVCAVVNELRRNRDPMHDAFGDVPNTNEFNRGR